MNSNDNFPAFFFGHLFTGGYFSSFPLNRRVTQSRFIEETAHELRLMHGSCKNNLAPNRYSSIGSPQVIRNDLVQQAGKGLDVRRTPEAK